MHYVGEFPLVLPFIMEIDITFVSRFCVSFTVSNLAVSTRSASGTVLTLASCGNQEKPQESTTTQAEETTTVESVPEQTESTPIYSITEENLSPELTMSRQPEASYWLFYD